GRWRSARVWRRAHVGRRRSAAARFCKPGSARRSARGIIIASPGHGFRRQGQRARLATFLGETKNWKIEPRHVGAAAADRKSNRHSRRYHAPCQGGGRTRVTEHRAHLVLLVFINP